MQGAGETVLAKGGDRSSNWVRHALGAIIWQGDGPVDLGLLGVVSWKRDLASVLTSPANHVTFSASGVLLAVTGCWLHAQCRVMSCRHTHSQNPPRNSTQQSHHHSHFTDDETETHRLRRLVQSQEAGEWQSRDSDVPPPRRCNDAHLGLSGPGFSIKDGFHFLPRDFFPRTLMAPGYLPPKSRGTLIIDGCCCGHCLQNRVIFPLRPSQELGMIFIGFPQ